MLVALNEVGRQLSAQAAIEERVRPHHSDARDLLDGRNKDGDCDGKEAVIFPQLVIGRFRKPPKNSIVQLVLREQEFQGFERGLRSKRGCSLLTNGPV
jgi:hypothetical protein